MKHLSVNNSTAKNNTVSKQTELHSSHQRRYALAMTLLIAAVPCFGVDSFPSNDAVIDSDETPEWRSNVYVTWASDYVYRGVSLTGSDPTWQGGADVAHRSGLFGGLWTSAIAFSPPIGPNTEHNVFAGYGRDFGMAWSGSVRLTHFDFRGGQVGPDNTFDQWQVDVQYNKATTVRVYQADNTYGMRFASTAVELQHVIPIADNWLISGLFGQWDLEKLSGDHYNYVEFGGSWSTQHVNIALQYHHADSRARVVYQDAVKPGWLVSVTYRIF